MSEPQESWFTVSSDVAGHRQCTARDSSGRWDGVADSVPRREPEAQAFRLTGMRLTRSIGPYLWRLLPVAVVLVTASCGVRAAGPRAPGPSAAPSSTAASATPAGSTAAGATPTRSAGGAAVIFGVVQAGPACPVDRVDHACRPRPLGHLEVQALSPSAGLVASARTQTDGRYTLHLAPGSYMLVVVTTQIFPRCPHPLVSVASGAAIRANINCDTGIRGPAAQRPAQSAA